MEPILFAENVSGPKAGALLMKVLAQHFHQVPCIDANAAEYASLLTLLAPVSRWKNQGT
jgi:hypothetical protein